MDGDITGHCQQDKLTSIVIRNNEQIQEFKNCIVFLSKPIDMISPDAKYIYVKFYEFSISN